MKSGFAHKQAQFFDGYAKNIHVDFENWSYAEKSMFDQLAFFLGDTSKKRILDLGCGTGRFGLKLASQAKEVIGIDISEKSIAVANKIAKKYNLQNFRAIKGDFNKLAYKDYFDYIIAVNLIHHIGHLDNMFLNVKKGLKKNGAFVIFEFNPLNPLFIPFLFLIKQLRNHLTKEYIRSNIFTLKNSLKKTKFKKIEIHRYALVPTTLYKYSNIFRKIDVLFNKIPFVRTFTAYHVIICFK